MDLGQTDGVKFQTHSDRGQSAGISDSPITVARPINRQPIMQVTQLDRFYHGVRAGGGESSIIGF